MSAMSAPQRSMPDSDRWPAFRLPADDTTSGPTDMSHLLDKPAGATGFIQIVDGHLATGDGKRWRIWGQNLTRAAALPPMSLAPAVARRLAKFGLNCLRLHHIDHRWPDGVLMRRKGRTPLPPRFGDAVQRDDEPTRALDPEAMARLDYFVHCCKKEGVYIDLNLNVSRPFTAADGVKQVDLLGYGKALTYFDPQLITLQKEYAAQLLGHVNPYTGNRYAEEPAVAIVELVNENSIVESWAKGRLRGEQKEPFGTWGDIPSSYAEDLDRLWNDWLLRRYPDREALRVAWEGDLREHEDAALSTTSALSTTPAQGSVRRLQPEDFAAASRGRFQDEATFYSEMERGFFQEMAAYLRGEIGVRQVIVGSSDHNHGMNNAVHVYDNAVLGIIDGHCYWQHPRYGVEGWTGAEWSISNTPMVDDPDHSAVAQLSRSAVAGLPYTLSEINEPFPNDYACEFIPIIAAYGLLQGWDGVFIYDYGLNSDEARRDQAIQRFFSIGNDPVKMAETAAGALMFLRGDVRAAERLVERRLTRERLLESLRTDLPDDEHPYAIHHIKGRLALVHRTVASFDAEEVTPKEGELALPEGDIVSDTGELTWAGAPDDGHVLVDAPRHQAVIGHAGRRATTHLEVELTTPFAAVQLGSLDEAPVAQAERLLLLTAARSANTGMRWTDDTRRSLGREWGQAPTRIEPVTGRITLRGLEGAVAVSVQPLDGQGQPMGAPIAAAREDGAFAVTLSAEPATLWYLITVTRQPAAGATN